MYECDYEISKLVFDLHFLFGFKSYRSPRFSSRSLTGSNVKFPGESWIDDVLKEKSREIRYSEWTNDLIKQLNYVAGNLKLYYFSVMNENICIFSLTSNHTSGLVACVHRISIEYMWFRSVVCMFIYCFSFVLLLFYLCFVFLYIFYSSLTLLKLIISIVILG